MKKLLLIFSLLPALSFAQVDFSQADKLARQKEYKKAKKEYSRIIKQYPDSYEAYLRRANLLFTHTADLANSIADYTKIIELNDTIAEAYAKRGLAYYYTSLKDDSRCIKAVADLDKAIELQAENIGKLYYARGQCRLILNRNDTVSACEDFLKAKEHGYTRKSYCDK